MEQNEVMLIEEATSEQHMKWESEPLSQTAMINAMSIDLEDWFCVNKFGHIIKSEEWDKYELRVYESTRRILNLLSKHDTRATFFVLGWIAERMPELVREIEQRNHEIASHGYKHLLLTQITPTEFEEDLVKSLDTTEQCGIKQTVIGFRAPSFTMVEKTMWALNILEKYNIKYDSSVFPIGFHHNYGVPNAPLSPYKITKKLYEVPISCVELCGQRIPCSGGAYFRILPYAYSKYCFKRCNAEGRAGIFYIHPWELDPGQPKVSVGWGKQLRHSYNIEKTERRLDMLLTDFKFTTIRDVLGI